MRRPIPLLIAVIATALVAAPAASARHLDVRTPPRHVLCTMDVKPGRVGQWVPMDYDGCWLVYSTRVKEYVAQTWLKTSSGYQDYVGSKARQEVAKDITCRRGSGGIAMLAGYNANKATMGVCSWSAAFAHPASDRHAAHSWQCLVRYSVVAAPDPKYQQRRHGKLWMWWKVYPTPALVVPYTGGTSPVCDKSRDDASLDQWLGLG